MPKKQEEKYLVVGRFLKMKRIKASITQLIIAEKAGVHVQSISNIERGKAHCPAHILRIYVDIANINHNEILRILLGLKEQWIRKNILNSSVRKSSSKTRFSNRQP